MRQTASRTLSSFIEWQFIRAVGGGGRPGLETWRLSDGRYVNEEEGRYFTAERPPIELFREPPRNETAE